MPLREYRKKRRFSRTSEPSGTRRKPAKHREQALTFVVQKHAATRLHFDFRLEFGGALKSWAVPKGPSLNPADKRLAVHVEDHPLDYARFEGHIPHGEYGAGDVIVWDIGTFAHPDGGTRAQQEKNLQADYKKGKLVVVLHGSKLQGEFTLVRTARQTGSKEQWLLIKHRDAFVSTKDVTKDDRSALSDTRLVAADPEQHAPMPAFFKPMLATLADKPFDKDGWIYEIKWDGFRALAFIDHKNIKLYSRNEQLFNKKFPSVAYDLQSLSRHKLVLDGEIIALDTNGKPDFQALQNAEREPAAISYAIFDLLYMDGVDLRNQPLIERKKLLQTLLKNAPPRLIYSDHVLGKGKAYFHAAEKKNLEGVMAKDGDSVYLPGMRAQSWLKLKTVKRQEAVIAGFTEPSGSRKHFGALVLGVYEGKTLTYIGHTGTGFDDRQLKSLHAKLKKLATKTSPFKTKVPLNNPVTWVKPKFVCEIKFAEWTSDGVMRQPVFLGLRDDKPAKDVTREQAKQVTAGTKAFSVAVTHEDKIFWPKEGYTKGDVIRYYDRIAETLLPYLKDRPESMLRQPHGVDGESFFQKNVTGKLPPYVRTETIKSDSESRDIRYIVCDNKETLLYMANLGCIELNPWNARVQTPHNPDYMIIDLDPAKKDFGALIKVAREVHRVLDLACQPNYIKTSGKRGLHIFVPLGAKYDYDAVRQFAQLMVSIVHRRLPTLTSIERHPDKRKGKIYLDYLQNRFAQTLACAYSLRPWPGATVSTPLKWTEIKSGLNPAKFTIETIFKRLQKTGDLWQPVITDSIDMRESLACLQKEIKKL